MSTFEMQVDALVPAPVERVFHAFVNPEIAIQWFCGEGIRPKELRIDPRPGGAFFASLIILNEEFVVTGRYHEVVPNEMLVFTHEWNDDFKYETLVTISFRAEDEGTKVTVNQQKFPNQGQADGQKNHWHNALDSLVQKFSSGGF